jgi:hypothetical protein
VPLRATKRPPRLRSRRMRRWVRPRPRPSMRGDHGDDGRRTLSATKSAVDAAIAARNALKTAKGQSVAAQAQYAQADAYLSAVVTAFETVATATPAVTSSGTKTVTSSPVCFPADAHFNVTSVVAATKTANTGAARATPADTQIVYGHFSSNDGFQWLHLFHFHALPPASVVGTTAWRPEAPTGRGARQDLRFTADQLSKQDFRREHLTWGHRCPGSEAALRRLSQRLKACLLAPDHLRGCGTVLGVELHQPIGEVRDRLLAAVLARVQEPRMAVDDRLRGSHHPDRSVAVGRRGL